MKDQMDVDQEKAFWLGDNFEPVFEEFTRTGEILGLEQTVPAKRSESSE
ncbi:MAG: hypothetical protein HOB98_13790 [Gammaproteobacteria bacterium]|jgi:hypothetical protein|nr:hypothetical protein [Gammaproteobacteria bacterium]MBT3869121.1 hypothetical protein [Gammaproteobacteria bacterium]MBT4378270.1 hypothetical protein [Gammaproteobacteria bacterium]MBT4617511.1 hypothetical protein [Gammaproteobacteria bacterium]MBT5197951.1 hypothetical protein [Gammaproteobacteria bacterium]